MTNYHCDWFELTEPLNSKFSDFMRDTLWSWGIRPSHGKGFNGYRERNEWAGSVTEQWSDHDERMGRHWRFSGTSWKAIQIATDSEPNWRYWLREWAKHGSGSVTRIDLASDFHETDARIVSGDIMHGMAEGLVRKRSWRTIENDALGYTTYFGSRKSDVMLRCYDKGAEIDLEPFKICRTEFEVKKAKSRALGDGMRALLQYGNDSEQTIGSWLERITFGLMLDFIPAHTLERLGVAKWGCQPIALGSWLPKITNQDAWWLNVVLPALVKRVSLPDGTLDNEFWLNFTSEFADRLAPGSVTNSGDADDPLWGKSMPGD